MKKREGEIEGFRNIQIEKARIWDYRKIAKIYMDEFSKPPYNDPWTLKTALNKIKIFSRYCDIWKIVLEHKEIIGFVIINPHHWYSGKFCFVENMAIKEEFKGRNIGTCIIKSIMISYKKQGFETLMGISNNNSRAFTLWESLGWKEDKYAKVISRRLN